MPFDDSTPRKGHELSGRSVNRYDLYELIVQEPDLEARFLHAVHGNSPHLLGEDFCGPAAIARAWITLSPDHRAVATDMDHEPLEHARVRAHEHLNAFELDRLRLIRGDAISVGGRADVIAALNFATCELRTRRQLMTYLYNVLFRLDAGGIFVADLYGGEGIMARGYTEQEIETQHGVIRYRWDQVEADPATGMVRNTMHFVLPDGTELLDAFSYEWRLWSTPELRDAMREIGFRTTEVYDSYGDAIDEGGTLYPYPISADHHAHVWPEDPGEPYVHYVVGRV